MSDTPMRVTIKEIRDDVIIEVDVKAYYLNGGVAVNSAFPDIAGYSLYCVTHVATGNAIVKGVPLYIALDIAARIAASGVFADPNKQIDDGVRYIVTPMILSVLPSSDENYQKWRRIQDDGEIDD